MVAGVLKDLLTQVTGKIKENKFIPLTQFVGIKSKHDTELELVATDGTNFVSGKETGLSGMPNADIAVVKDTLVKLISSLPYTLEIVLAVQDDNLVITGDGICYKLQAIKDTDGLVTFKDVQVPKVSEELNLQAFRNSYSKVQNSIDPQGLVPYLSAVYVSESMYGTNNYLLAKSDCGKMFGEDVLLPLPLCENILQIAEDTARFKIDGDTLTVFTNQLTVQGKLHDGIASYPVKMIDRLFSRADSKSALVSVDLLADALNRVSLFVNTFDDNAMQVSFNEQGMTVSSVTQSGREVIPYSNGNAIEQAPSKFDIRLLTRLAKTFVGTEYDDVSIYVIDNQAVAQAGDTKVILAGMR